MADPSRGDPRIYPLPISKTYLLRACSGLLAHLRLPAGCSPLIRRQVKGLTRKLTPITAWSEPLMCLNGKCADVVR